MALNTQQVNIQFQGGIDQKTNEQLVIPSKLLRAENVEFSGDTLERRCLLEALNYVTGVPVRAYTVDDYLCVEHSTGVTYRVSDGQAKLQTGEAGGSLFKRIAAQSENHVRLADGRAFDCAADGSGNECVAWESVGAGTGNNDTTGRTSWEVRDSQRNTTYSGSTEGVKPRVLYIIDKFYIFVARAESDGTTIYRVDSTSGAVASIASSANTTPGNTYFQHRYDVTYQYPYCGLALGDCGDSSFNLYTFDVSSFWSPVTGGAALSGAADGMQLACCYDSFSNLRVAYNDSGSIKETYLTTGGTVSTTTFPYLPAATGRVLVRYNSGLFIVYDCAGGQCEFQNTGSGSNGVIIQSHCQIASGFFSLGALYFYAVAFESQQYQSVLLLQGSMQALTGYPTPSATPTIVGRLDWGEVAQSQFFVVGIGSLTERYLGTQAPKTFTRTGELGTTDVVVPYQKWAANTRLAGGWDSNKTLRVLALAQLDETSQLGDVEWQKTKLLAGALPRIHDGTSLVEADFHFAPEIQSGSIDEASGVVVVPPTTTGSGIWSFPEEGKTYDWVLTMGWTDARGNWCESGVAYSGRTTTSAGNTGCNPTVVLPPTEKQAQVLLYRTAGSSTDTTLYLVGSLGTVQSDGTCPLAYVDNAGTNYVPNDTQLVAGEVLYTEGGVLPNSPMPSCRHLALYQDRVVATGCLEPRRIYFSKAQSPGFLPEFVVDDAAFQQTAPSSCGRLVASCEESDRLNVFGENAIGVIYGNAPDSTGGGGYQRMVLVVYDRGALWRSPKAVVKDEGGIWFHAQQGLRRLKGGSIERDQSGRELGCDVEETVQSFASLGGSIVGLASAGVSGVPNTRFFFTKRSVVGTSTDVGCLVWSQQWQQFTQHTNHASVDVVASRHAYVLVTIATLAGSGQYAVRRLSQIVSYEDAAVLSNGTGAVTYKSKLRTAWLSFGGVQGFQRLKNILLLMKTSDTQGIILRTRYNFLEDSSFVDEVSAGGGNRLSVSPVSGRLQIRHQFWTQKCESMQLELEWVPTGAKPSGETYWPGTDPAGAASQMVLTDMALWVGVKPRFRKPTQL